ncbi:hypothetical protein Q3G72_020236 [Acer saccharum]|nr:hypothetical protein Q3G72_020236 [Acer saccharum]
MLKMVLKIMSRHWILSFLVGLALSTVLLVHAQNQTGFISIDCGTPKDFAYTERTTGINYISDANFTDTGVGYNISSEYNSDNLEQPFLNVRSFPEGSRSCYTLNPYRVNTGKFLIRASFMYGNYDGQNKLPRFGLLLEADEWDTVQFKDASTIVYKEIIHVPKKNYIDVCLVNTGFGTPFISALELRTLRNGSYPTDPGISLLLFSRLDIGSMVNDKENFRLKDDVYDRIWSPYTKSNWVTISSPFNVHYSQSYYLPPSTVMQTSAMPENGCNSLMLSLSSIQGHKQFQTEVELLLRVHHKNLTSLVGYCDDGTNMGLIYEFMSNGNLESHLLDEGSSTADILSWGGRLRIATETAQGLEYLHSGLKLMCQRSLQALLDTSTLSTINQTD